MIQKTFILATFAILALTSCEKDTTIDGNKDPYEFLGSFSVKQDGSTTYSEDDTKFRLEFDKDNNTLKLRMYQIKFDHNMPVRLNINAKNLQFSESNGTGSSTITSVVPTVGGVPMGKYTLHNLNINWDTDSLHVNFLCKGYIVDYHGKN